MTERWVTIINIPCQKGFRDDLIQIHVLEFQQLFVHKPNLNQLSFLTKYILIVDSVASSQTWLGGDGAWCFSEAGHWQHQRGHQRWLAITQKTCCFASPHRNIDITLIADSVYMVVWGCFCTKAEGRQLIKKNLIT